MWGYPYTSAAGATLMAAVLITTAFTQEFRMTLVYGVPFLAVLTVIYYVWHRRPVASVVAAAK
jgi:L-asparagine transporter-like permease